MNDKQRNSKFKKERTSQLKAGLKIRKDTYTEIKSLLNQAEADIKVILATQPSDYQQWVLPKIQQQIRNTLDQVAETSATKLSQSANTSWQMGLDLVDQPIAAGGIRIAGMLPHVDMGQLKAMRTFMVDRIKDVPLAMAEKISSQLGLVMIGSQGVGDAVSNIANLFEKQGRTRALTIVRTELGRAYGVATQKRLTQAREHLPGLKKQWRRSGKVHSRVGHDTIDGQTQDVDKPFILGNGVKLMHPRDPAASVGETINCGCESLPWMDSWKVKTPGKKAFTLEEIARNPMKADLTHAKSL